MAFQRQDGVGAAAERGIQQCAVVGLETRLAAVAKRQINETAHAEVTGGKDDFNASSRPRFDARLLASRRISHDGIRRGLKFMLSNLHLPIKVSDVVRVSGMSFRAFHSAFKTHVGHSPGQAMKSLRIQRAKELLRQDYRIRAVVTQCGFRTISAFDIAFKRAEGVSPSVYQKRLALRNGSPAESMMET